LGPEELLKASEYGRSDAGISPGTCHIRKVALTRGSRPGSVSNPPPAAIAAEV
jgi:hypothetical protein